MLQQEQAQAQNQLVSSLRTQSQGDMASLMARYGSQLALGLSQPPAMTRTAPAAPYGAVGKA
jgi:hypothetical protein